MERIRKKRVLVFAVLAAVLVVLFAAVLFLTRGIGGQRGFLSAHPLRISELMARNTTVPNADGVLCDWIEIENTSDSIFNISGYKLSDDLTGAKYTFPVGTEIPAHGFLVVSCTEEQSGGLYAAFSLSKSGGETVTLTNASNVMLDSVTTIATRKNTVMVRAEDGSLELSASPTPGYPNTAEGYEQYMAANAATNEFIRLSEIMSSNTLYPDAAGYFCDWIEVANTSSENVDISGYMLSDTPGSYRFAFADGTVLAPGARLVVSCTEEYSGALVAPFAMPKHGGETIVLTDANAIVLDMVELPSLRSNEVYARVNGEWTILPYATPGYDNSEDGYAAFVSSHGYDSTSVVVSEAMPSNAATLPDSFGEFSDWMELMNTGSEAVDLGGWYLSDDEQNPAKWRIPDGTVIAPGAYLTVFCSGRDRLSGELHTDFSLSPSEKAILASPLGTVVSVLPLDGCRNDWSAILRADGSVGITPWATPGFSNDASGYEAMQAAQTRTSPLLISEVLVYNDSQYYQKDVGYFDIVEVRNVSNEAVELGDYMLTDKLNGTPWQLPAGTLGAGQRVFFYCSGDVSKTTSGRTHTSFSLNGQEETLYLLKTDGTLCDWVWLHDIPLGGSMGRADGENGWYYYNNPAPGNKKSAGTRSVSEKPLALTKDGVFNNTPSVTVELAGTQTIYYTTDGSVPTVMSTVYTAPFTVDKTCVVRAMCKGEGQLPSDILTLSYILNENHTLPVASLVMAEAEMGGGGMYKNPFRGDRVGVTMSLYEDDGSFTVDCGAQMYGHTALQAPKRSFKLVFRSAYGDKALDYDVFDTDEVQHFTSLVLRAGQDYPYAIFRDELFTGLAAEFSDNIVVQRCKPVILYINGQYWGIYFIKEAFSEDMFASEFDVSPESVTKIQAPVGSISELREALNFAYDADLSKKENYEKLCSMVNIDSLIDWAIMEGYSANGDVQQNLRYFRSTENGNQWYFAYYDLDWAFYYTYNNFTKIFGGMEGDEPLQHQMFCKSLLANDEFCRKFARRYAEAINGVLSREHVLQRIDEWQALLAPEVPRERERWSGATSWEGRVQELRNFIINNDWENMTIYAVSNYCRLSKAERQEIFGK